MSTKLDVANSHLPQRVKDAILAYDAKVASDPDFRDHVYTNEQYNAMATFWLHNYTKAHPRTDLPAHLWHGEIHTNGHGVR